MRNTICTNGKLVVYVKEMEYSCREIIYTNIIINDAYYVFQVQKHNSNES